MSSSCQTISFSILFNIITNTLMFTPKLHGCVAIMANKVIKDIFAKNCMKGHTTFINFVPI